MTAAMALAAEPALLEPVRADVEIVVRWALAHSGNLSWDRTSDRELAFDQGVTAKPRRKESGNWALAEACAGLRFGPGRSVPARMIPPDDAAAVIAAIKRLPPRTASLVLACARAGIRPDWMPGAEPKRIPKRVSWRRCKRGQQRIRMVWDIDPATICAAREAYTLWHDGMTRLTEALRGTLERWEINGFAAPAQPWRTPPENTA